MAVKKRKEASVQDFIDKGADVKASEEKSFKNVLIRMPVCILDEVDQALKKKPWSNRTQWIIDAIYEKVKFEG